MAKTGLIAVVAGLIIGAAMFIYVAATMLSGLKATSTSTTFNSSIDGLITLSFTCGSLMSIAAVAVIGFWIVKSVIGGS